MILGSITSKIRINKATKMVEDLLVLAKKQVLVGVPSSTNPRKEGEVGNAMLAYIHDNGSPLRNIPARPFMQPGIKAAQDRINAELLGAVKAQTDGDKEKVDLRLNRAGLVAQNSIRNVINDGIGFEPLKRSTKLGRLRKRKGSSKWKEAKREEVMGSFHPLIDTGQLRNSITYVVVKKS